ncbi:MAG: TonB-dependent receptor [Chloroherpetonaceae bacterium]|nr:TonB-dependent receptor [Chloroherpetonaceae bacterium]
MKKNLFFSIIFIHSFNFFCLSSNLYAQSDSSLTVGSVVGRIFDKSTKEEVIGASVRVVGTAIGTKTNVNGRFTLTKIPVGTYQLLITAVGYESLYRSDVVVSTGRPFSVVIELVEKDSETAEVEVVADYFSRKKTDSPTSEQTLSYEEIRRFPGGFEDVVRAISTLPGVAQVQNGRNDLLVRGGAPSENLFLIDGVESPNINHFGTQGAGGGPLSFVNLDFVRDVSFSTGGFGTKYGDKVSSVLTLDLRNGRDDRLGGKLNLSASQFGANIEGPLSQNGQFLFSARRSYLDLIFKAAGFAFVPEYYDFLGKFNFNLGDGNEISGVGIGVINNVRQFTDTEEQRFDNATLLDNTQYQIVAGVTWKKLFKGGYVSTTLGRTRIDYRFRQRDSLLVTFFQNNSIEDEFNLRSDAFITLGEKTELSFGFQAKTIGFDADIQLNPTANSAPFAPLALTKSDRFFKGALYAQIGESLGDFRFTLGARADYFSPIQTKLYPSLRSSVSYRLFEKSTLSVSGGRYFQSPSYIWLVANSENLNLKSIQTDVGIVGFEQIVGADWKFSVEGYFKNYSNYPTNTRLRFLTLANTGAGFGGSEEGFTSFGLDRLTSEGNGRAYGFEVFAQKKLSETRFYGIASFSVNWARFTALDGVERAGNFDQRLLFNLSGGYKIDEDWEVGTRFRFATGRPFTEVGADGDATYGFRRTNIDPMFFNAGRLPSSYALDIRVDKRWQFTDWTLITYIDIQNITNQKNADQPRWDVRNNQILDDSPLGLLPTIGINAEF